MLVSPNHNQNAHQIQNSNKNFIQEDTKRRLHSGNACYHSVQNLLSSRLLSKNVNVRMYKTIACGSVWE
jgi:hypothetical protein